MLIDDGMGQLPRSVGAEIEEDDCVPVLHWRRSSPVRRRHPGWYQELVGNSLAVACLDECDRPGGRRPLALDHGPEGSLGALPSPVAVHGVVAARYRGDLAHPDGLDLLLELADISGRARRGLVAPVGEDMHEDAAQTLLLRHPEQGI